MVGNEGSRRREKGEKEKGMTTHLRPYLSKECALGSAGQPRGKVWESRRSLRFNLRPTVGASQVGKVLFVRRR